VDLHSCPLQLIIIMTQIIMGQSVFSSLSRCYPLSQGVSLCRSSLDGSFGFASVLIFQRCFFLQDLRQRSRPPTMVIAPASLTFSPYVKLNVSMKHKHYEHLFMFIRGNGNINNLFLCCHYLHFYMFYVSLFVFIYRDDEGTPFMTFVRKSLYPKEDNVLKDECPYPLTIVLLYSWCITSDNKDQHWRPPSVNSLPQL
jgi:hypothetical protein